jgi:hypothetical protein
VSLDTTHFAQLRAEPYYVCEKTDGVRHALVCCTLALPDGSVNLVALVDRALAVYIMPVRHTPKAMFQGTLLDGELVWNAAAEGWEYLVFDGMCVSGIPVLNGTLPDRLSAVRKALSAYRHAAEHDPVRITIKSFLSCSNMDDAEAHLSRAHETYGTDGVILTPARAPVVYGRHMALFKLKFGSRHTVDFLVGQDGRQLSVFDNGRHVQVATLSTSAAPGCIVECSVSANGGSGVWDVVLVRTDKTTANDMFTYQKTMLNMREKLSWAHVRAAFATRGP